MRTGWLLYDEPDYELNRGFTEHMMFYGAKCGLALHLVFTEKFEEAIQHSPDFVVSRQRNAALNARLEAMSIPVFNNSRVCEICNDKRNTHRFLEGLPLMQTAFATPEAPVTPEAYPVVVKPAFGHGGDHVALVNSASEYEKAISLIFPQPALVQEPASDAGKDLRIYVLFGEILAAVMRTARTGIVSNFKRGGSVALHKPTDEERALAHQVIRRFADAGAPLSFAGIDMIFHHGKPVINEVEDVVGSRMLYKVSNLDSVALYVEAIANRLSHDKKENL